MQKNNTKTYLILIALITAAILGYIFLNPPAKPTGSQTISSISPAATQKPFGYNFTNEKGQTVILENSEAKIDVSVFTDNAARFYNVQMPSGKTVYFFVVKDQSGTIRAAANACQVCFGVRKGFHQEGNKIVCNNCGNRYPLEKIATEKGGCNPGPINPDLEVKDGKVVIKQSGLEQVAEFF